MNKPDLGTKRTCIECGARFFDLSKMPVECPKCGTAYTPDILLPAKEPRPDAASSSRNWQKPKPPPVVEDTEDDDGDDTDDTGDALGDDEDTETGGSGGAPDADTTLPELDDDDDEDGLPDTTTRGAGSDETG